MESKSKKSLIDYLQIKFNLDVKPLNFRFPIETLGRLLKKFYKENEKAAFLVQANSGIPNLMLKRISGSYLLQVPMEQDNYEHLYIGLSDVFSFLILFNEPPPETAADVENKSNFFLTFDQDLIRSIFNYFYKSYSNSLTPQEKKLLIRLKNVKSQDLNPKYISKFQEALLISALTDTNKLKQAKLVEAISFTGEALVITDLTGKIIESNKNFDNVFNQNRNLQCIDELLPKDSFENALQTVNSRKNWHMEITLERSDKTKELSLVSSYLFKDELSRLSGYVFTFKDVTDLRKLDLINKQLITKLREQNIQLSEVNKRLLEADRIKSDLLSVVSHELKTPIATIMGFSELLTQRDNDPGSIRIYANQINESGKRLEKLITDYLDVASDQFGITNDQLYTTPLNLSELIRVIYNEQVIKFSERNYELKIEMLGYEPIIISEALNMKKLFTNLINNSLKYSPNGSLIKVKMLNDGEQVTVSISDNGIGISTEQAIKVFEPFYRLDNSITREFSGIGLGLPVCKKIVDIYKGSIWCEPSQEGGTTFFVTLPVNPHTQRQKEDKIEKDLNVQRRKEAKKHN
ncbi:MAG: PAS domain-containing sensor histidine kinase [Candidatus Melainabacteria bacterium]|nr:PAS domain-containing sensor histidine kinase [Candidatus Melainabacteria bacterium]MBI3309076.1 PAS domain-containing sensor histidine kinase [Candidatus Melainabacteria bacterium]